MDLQDTFHLSIVRSLQNCEKNLSQRDECYQQQYMNCLRYHYNMKSSNETMRSSFCGTILDEYCKINDYQICKSTK